MQKCESCFFFEINRLYCFHLSDPKRPDLSQYSVYEAHMEANIVNKNYTIDYTEYFDYPNKRAATHITKSGEHIYEGCQKSSWTLIFKDSNLPDFDIHYGISLN